MSTPIKRKREDESPITQVVASPSQTQSPTGPAMIGPTPQRDGIVLGLFDLLPLETPSKTRHALIDVELNTLQTPSKNPGKAESDISLESRARGEKTPLSAGKRFLLDSIVTPQKRKLGTEGTPTSVLKGFSTPSFLRRDNYIAKIDETDETTPRPIPWKRKGLGRSLSAIIQAKKQEEEARFDEEEEIMRELEMEAEGLSVPKKPRISDALVKDSQTAMPLGPDRGLESEDEENSGADNMNPDGNQRKVWKKRGHKRQTRQVISRFCLCNYIHSPNTRSVRPSFLRPKREQKETQDDASEDDVNVGGTQAGVLNHVSDLEGSADDNGSDFASDDSHSVKKRKTKPAPNIKAKDGREAKEGPITAAARKIKATAHANYRRLKIKSKGNGGKGRFGRRR